MNLVLSSGSLRRRDLLSSQARPSTAIGKADVCVIDDQNLIPVCQMCSDRLKKSRLDRNKVSKPKGGCHQRQSKPAMLILLNTGSKN